MSDLAVDEAEFCRPCEKKKKTTNPQMDRLKREELDPLEIIAIFRRLKSDGKTCSCTENCFDLILNPPEQLREDLEGQYGGKPNNSGRELISIEK